MATSKPVFAPGTNGTFYAASAVTGARFVKSASTQGNGNYGMVPCTAGAKPLGVAERDRALGQSGLVHRRGSITEVTASGALTAGMPVASDSVGRAVDITTVSGAAAVAASLLTGVVASNNAIRWTARDAGDAGNGVSVTILGSTGANVSLSVAVNGNDIVVTPATNGSSVVTSTATLVEAAIAASAAANALVSVANESTSTGAGVVTAVSATNLAGGADARATAYLAGIAVADAADGALAMIDLV